MDNILFLSDSIKLDFSTLEPTVKSSLASIGINNNSDYDKKLSDVINCMFPKLNISSVVYCPQVPFYSQNNVNKSLGVVGNYTDNKALVYIILVPSTSAGSRTGLIAQQLFPTVTDLMHERHLSFGNIITNKPILVINANNETYTPGNALSIIGASKIPGVFYTDFYGRTPETVLEDKGVNYSLSNIMEFSEAVNQISNRSGAKFEYDRTSNTLRLLKGNLKDPGNGMTNEPYYYFMQVFPAISLASINGTEIDDSVLRTWWSMYSSSKDNKNVKYFIEWLDKLKNNGGKSVQKIYFGSPGTGKSHDIEQYLKVNVDNYDQQVFRTTFHPDYSYVDFVGQIIPSRIYNATNKNYDISYEFYEGVFTRALKQAYEDLDNDVYLVVEEMSRGNVAAIFGDLFQLLDRNVEGVEKGWSKYGIRNNKIANQILQLPNDVIKLPPNFHIFGTVNTSDQNVFTMDTAFKRRFQWGYIKTAPILNKHNLSPANLGEKYLNNPILKLNFNGTMQDVYWSNLYGALNIYISDSNYLGLGEDKQVGPFFIDFTALNDTEVKEEIQNKLFNYLWTDIANGRNSKKVPLFNIPIVSSFSSLYSAFESNQQVFSNEFITAYNKWLNNNL